MTFRIRGIGRTGPLAVLIAVTLSVALFAAACSSGGSSGADGQTASDDTSGDVAGDSGDSGDDGDGTDGDSVDVESGDATSVAPTPPPTLADADLAGVIDLAPGEQVEDTQGNLIAVYGAIEWPLGFADLTIDAQRSFPFFGDMSGATDSAIRIVAVDVGMCAAGIDATGSASAEFFAASGPTAGLSTDPVLDRAVLTSHPVVQPSFAVPEPGTCNRGWLPVFWAGNRSPRIARYVLTLAAEGSDDSEVHVYQWSLSVAPSLPAGVSASDDEAEPVTPDGSESPETARSFLPGETVTFTEGPLADTTVYVEGWSELIGQLPAIDGTRMVTVSVRVCPAGPELPQFGIGVDGWNLIAPVGSEDFLERLGTVEPESTDGEANCAAGRLDFAVPLGTVPTAFFVSDGQDPVAGYAEWSLAEAAIELNE